VSDLIELCIPVKADLVVLARLTAATVASRAGFDVEEIEDLRLAVDELCLSLVRASTTGRLELRYTGGDGVIEISATLMRGKDESATPESGELGYEDGTDELSGRILDALVDAHGHDDSSGAPTSWLRKQRQSSQV
jgi:serine/threonine-protein kinase RsbW